jgi:predicted RNA-binding Zn-ribbon protein involved in translation (DUF1610 family)
MSLKKKAYKRPQCESCGAKIYPKVKPFRRNNIFFGDLPSYCPNCGNEISNEKNAQVANYGHLSYCLLCIGSIIFIVVVLIIFSSI